MEYLWTKEITPPSFDTLHGDKKTKVLIIGGGMAGVLCALKLKEAGVDYMLVEAKQIGDGITKGTTAVLTAQHDTLYQDLIKNIGFENAKLYLKANLQAVKSFRELSAKIDCDFEEKPSFMYSLTDKARMEREVAAVKSLGFNAELTLKTPLPFDVAAAVRYPGMAQFHPLKFLYNAAKGLNIYENTFVEKLDGTTAATRHGIIQAEKVIVATHFPFINAHGFYFTKLFQQRSYVIALENALDLGCTIEDVAENGIYMRNYNNLLLIGGGDNRTGQKGEKFSAPRMFAQKYFPKAKEKYSWANQDCVSLDGAPYIGEYSAGLPNVYVASGFNLWGMTTSMAAAEILSKLVQGQKAEFSPAFAPDRSVLKKQLFKNLGTTLLNFATPTTKRCSHLGCALKWNSAEHSWDCPCHGSRFDSSGKLINNPAMKDSHIN